MSKEHYENQLDFSQYGLLTMNEQRLGEEIKSLEEELSMLNEYYMNISNTLTGVPGGNAKQDKVPDFVIKLDRDRQDLKKQLAGLIDECIDIGRVTRRMKTAINCIHDKELRVIAGMHYFEGRSVSEIADAVSLSRQSVYRRVDEINKILYKKVTVNDDVQLIHI